MKKKTAYFIGIKGAGMAALAQIFKKEGWQVFGSDVKDKFFTDKILKKAGIKVFNGFKEKNILKADIYISSNAYLAEGINNPEINYLKGKKIKIYSYPQALAKIFNKKYGIAIAGTHGKSTTTSMAGVILEKAGFWPKVLVGAEVLNWHSNVFLGKGKYFIIEADEYKSAFLNYKPQIAIINSVEYDHPDYFKTKKEYLNNFLKFASNLKSNGKIIASREVSTLLFKKKLKNQKLTVDVLNKNQKILFSLKASNLKRQGIWQIFDINFKGKTYKNLKIKIGEIYLKNALLVITLGIILDIKEKDIKKGILAYKGTGRRFEISKIKNLTVIDDFAHHPTAIKQTISLAKKVFPDKKIIAVFQSHTFSRTKKFLNSFAKSLKQADKIIILPIFASAREKQKTVSAKEIYFLLRRENKNTFLADNFLKASQEIKHLTKSNQKDFLVLLLGAGDIYKIKKLLK